MSALAAEGLAGVTIKTLSMHVFRCPYCHNYTTLASAQSFIREEITECHSCARIFEIENDVAHAFSSLNLKVATGNCGIESESAGGVV